MWTKLIREGMVSQVWYGSFSVPQDCQGNYTYGPDEYGSTLIRQSGRQLRILDAGTDQLLYEFDLHTGDTLPPSWNNWSNTITVTGVDSVLVGTEMRARYALANSWASYLVEGVGSSHGLLEPVTDFFDCGYTLECFGVENVPCSINMGISATPGPVQPAVFPNPGTDGFTLTLTPGPHTITLFDATGRMVLQRSAQGPRHEFHADKLPSGIYLMKVDDQPSLLRWVKQ